MDIAYRSFHVSNILTKLCHILLLQRKLPYDHATKPLNVSIFFVKGFLKSHSFQETRVSSTVSTVRNRADKIILNIFGVAI